jgi:hypothetical protein
MATTIQEPLAAQPPPGGAALGNQATEAATEAPANQYGVNNVQLPEPLQTKLKELARKFMDEDKFSRRLEIQESRKAHFYWRDLQHLYWDGRAEGWVAYGPNGNPMIGDTRQSYNNDSSVLYSTNIYKPFGLTLIAVLTQSVPEVIAVPADGEDAADLATARAGNRFRKIIEHKNDATMILTKAMFFAYVDGRILAWTRSVMNPRTQKEEVKITVHGTLECKVPITTECMEEMVYIQLGHEQHVAIAKFENPDFKKKIKGGAIGSGMDVYERTARVSVAQGTSYMSGSGDTLVNLATVQHTWMRPAAFEMLESDASTTDDPEVDQLRELFKTGCHLKMVSGEYVGSWDESMDDHLQIMNALPGDGQFRNSLGHDTESVQERFNDIINIAQDVYEKTQPAVYADVEMADPNATFRQQSKPGARIPVKKKPGEPISESFYNEPASAVSPDMLQYGNDLMGPVGQLTSGAFTALTGAGDAKGAAGDTASGYAMQKEQAMGRLGLVYRDLKRWWAEIMGQAVKCAALLKADMSLSIPDANGEVETTTVRIEDLQGDVHWYPEGDEGIPANWSSKKATVQALLVAADANPILAGILADPRNQEAIQTYLGIDDLVVPAAESWAKQMAEINEMENGEAQPNPAFLQLQQKLQAMQEHSAQGGLHNDGEVEQLAMQLQSTPQMLSSVPIDPQIDDNAAEAESGKIWMRGPAGQKAKVEKPAWYMNVRVHVLAHDAAAKAQMPPPMPPPHAGHLLPAKPAAGSGPGISASGMAA